jgi:NAD(P)-dependent dehydrogenase (short-subunit alcohol dehydrogenase family)
MPSVLITGASRGIGRATALRLSALGWDVTAGVRQEQDAEALTAASPGPIKTVILDVTNEDHIAGLDAKLPQQLDAIVNSAGVVVGGPVEAVPAAELRRQLEVNVVGQTAVTQVVLPRLRASRGRVLFLSSVSGLISTPMMGPYSASKFALEGLADALRMELAPWGVRVILIEPAQTDTDLWRHADAQLEESVAVLAPDQRELYAKHISGFRKTIPRSQRMAAPADGVAATIEKALTATRPRARYIVGASANVQAKLALATPTRARDALLRAGTGVPRRP